MGRQSRLVIDRCALMSTKHLGSCLCGEVRYEVSGDFERFFLCHCSRCRKGTGSAHGANLFSSTATLTWLSGEDKVKAYRVPSTRHQRGFCSECGSPVPRFYPAGPMLVVPAGSLDSALEKRPTAHIFVASRASWDDCLEDVAKLDELPG